MQKFFTNTIESKFIKSLLKSTPIPRLSVAVGNSKMIEGNTYIYKNNIIKCTQSGVLLDEYSEVLLSSEDVLASDSTILESGVTPAKYKIIRPYIFGDDDKSICERYISKSDYYDSTTHYFLGQYLRCIRNSYGIDLMPLYNCYGGKTAPDFYLSQMSPFGFYKKDDKSYRVRTKETYKTMMVPIKFNTNYTVAIDCNTNVLIESAVYGSLGMLSAVLPNGFDGIVSEQMVENNGESVISLSSAQFNKPFIYSISSSCALPYISERMMSEYEGMLYLVIQVPSTNTSSVVVLEGDYTNCKVEKIFDISSVYKISESRLNSILLSDLSLLQLNDNNIYAFSDRLVEYLLLNVIDTIDPIWQNITRVRQYTNIHSEIDGVWDNSLRAELFNRYMADNRTRKIDVNGFVDKDMEKFITRGLQV